MQQPAAVPGQGRYDQRCPAAAGHGPAPCAWRSLGDFPDISGKIGKVTVEQCGHCGLGITRPPLPDVAFLYAGRASQDFQQADSRLSRAIKLVAFASQARGLLAQIGQWTRLAADSPLLDFGCGSGLFTRRLGDLAGANRVVGSDFEPEPPLELADRRYVAMGDLAPLRGSFGVVLAMHVLEHDDDATALLARITGMARPGGIVVIEVPNVECCWTGLFGKAWDAWYLPYHRTHFSRTALRALAERQGLEVLALHDVCVPTMGRSLSNLAGGDKGLFWLLAGIAVHPLQWLGERVTGRPSALRMIVRTPG